MYQPINSEIRRWTITILGTLWVTAAIAAYATWIAVTGDAFGWDSGVTQSVAFGGFFAMLAVAGAPFTIYDFTD